jgi:hypothetical protein
MLACVLVSFSIAANAAWDGTGPGSGVTGNDTGGIIQWTPETAPVYHYIAAEHCARWNRIAEITSVHARYGDYVGFACRTDRRFDPRKAWLTPYYMPSPPAKP